MQKIVTKKTKIFYLAQEDEALRGVPSGYDPTRAAETLSCAGKSRMSSNRIGPDTPGTARP